MITRKAILAAFELIADDKSVRTVTVFCDVTVLLSKIERVRITRIHRGKQDFRVQLGKPNYAERDFIRKQARVGKIKDKIMVSSKWPVRKVA